MAGSLQKASNKNVLDSQHMFNEVANIDDLNRRSMFSLEPSELLRIIKTTSLSKKEQAICFKEDDAYTFTKIERNSSMGTFNKLGIGSYDMKELLHSFQCDVVIRFPDNSLEMIQRAAENQNAPIIKFLFIEGDLSSGSIRILVEVRSKSSVYFADLHAQVFEVCSIESNLAELIDRGKDIPNMNQIIQRQQSKVISDSNTSKQVLTSDQIRHAAAERRGTSRRHSNYGENTYTRAGRVSRLRYRSRLR